ncbi:aspartic peptidase domain-containing protein [Rhexocercosporidium sp. MPI-PUGE-AT-0058]|nr:aspartic peptidase domain-containing protein [Rhexocercosporidium sp. MPI-PUGE-AT-0058]
MPTFINISFLCLLAALAQPNLASQIPSGYIAVPLIRNSQFLAYLAQISVGTPPQKEYLLVDTGSSTISFYESRSTFCNLPREPCAEYGSYDNISSSTSTFKAPFFNDGLIDYGSGDYLTDSIGLGGVSTPNITFGYITRVSYPERIYGSAASILGLGLTCSGSDAGPSCGGEGPYLLPQLKNASTIDRMAVNIYLGPENPNVTNAEMILGGAYDEAKLGGELFTVDMIDPHSFLSNRYTNWVNVTSIEAEVNGETAKVAFGPGPSSQGKPHVVDTGNPYWALPTSIFSLISSNFGGLSATTSSGTYAVDCKYRDQKNVNGSITVTFGSAGKIDVPLHTLITDFGNGTCTTAVENYEGGSLGDLFLRNTYSIFDQESFTLSLAQVKHTTERHIVSYPKGGFKVAEERY